jgi:DNA-binding transcriptional ArsR family regulator
VAAGETKGRGIGDQLLKAISHPIRIEVLRVLGTRVASPKELALECGESIGDVSYHVKYLRLGGWIEMLDTKTRRGAIEHYYRLKDSSAASADTIRSLVGEAVRALNSGTLDAREDRRLSWTTMELDERGWRELAECQSRWLDELDRVKAEAADRLTRESAPGTPVVAAVLGFETPSAG